MAYNTFIRGSSPVLESHQKKNDSLEQLNLSLEDYFETADALISRASDLNDIALENTSNQILSNSDVKRIYRYVDELGIQIQHQVALENHRDTPVTWNVAMEGIGEIVSKIIEGIKKVISFIIDKIKSLFGFGGGSSSGASDSEINRRVVQKEKDKLKKVKEMLNPSVPKHEKEKIAESIAHHFGSEWINSLGSSTPMEKFLHNFSSLAGFYIGGIPSMYSSTIAEMNNRSDDIHATMDDAKCKIIYDRFKGKQITVKYDTLNITVPAITAFAATWSFDNVENLDESELTSQFTKVITKILNTMLLMEEYLVSEKVLSIDKSKSGTITYSNKEPILGQYIDTTITANDSGYSIDREIHRGFNDDRRQEGKHFNIDKLKFDSPDAYLKSLDEINKLIGVIESKTNAVFNEIVNTLENVRRVYNDKENEFRRNSRDATPHYYELYLARTREIMETFHLFQKILFIRLYRPLRDSVNLIKYIIPQKWEDVKK